MRVSSTISMLTVAAATTAGVQTAAADGYVEGIVGLAIPVGDDDYDGFADESLKLGMRAGGGAGPTALELALDFTPVNPEAETGLLDISVQRYRMLVAARHRVPAGPGTVFLRAGLGVDVLHYSASRSIFGVMFEASETDPGIAAEVGGGITVPVGGKLYVGGHFALPMAFHFDDDDPMDPEDTDLEYTGYDIDLLLTIGTRQ